MPNASLVDDKIVMRFPYDPALVGVMRSLPDREWDPKTKAWTVPASRWHVTQVLPILQKHKFDIDRDILNAGGVKATKVRQLKGLYPFQKVGVEFITQAQGRALIADEPGLGKTITTLGYLHTLKKVERVLVVAPTNVTFKWVDETRKWLKWEAEVVEKVKQPMPDAQVVVMSYDMMRRRYNELANMVWSVLVLDECHYLAHQKTQRTRTAKAL